MYIEEDKDLCLTNTNYSIPYPLDYDEAYSHDKSKTLPNSTHAPSKGRPDQSYLSIDDLNCILRNKGKGNLFALHLNAVSFMAHHDEIESLIDSKIVSS